MNARVSATVVVACLSVASWADAQQVPAALQPAVAAPAKVGDGPSGLTIPSRPARNPFAALGHDLKTLGTSRDTALVLGTLAPIAAIAASWDDRGIEESREHLPQPVFTAGNIGGSFLVQTGAALGTWAAGTLAGQPLVTEVGGDLIRAQLTSQVVVQGLKLAVRRQRPDESDSYSFPSGHTASAFATATVLGRHFGWKAGIPAYGFATYVGLARMSADKHHVSDVIMGAALGIASARAVTVGVGSAKFSVGVAPASRGAAITFTKQ